MTKSATVREIVLGEGGYSVSAAQTESSIGIIVPELMNPVHMCDVRYVSVQYHSRAGACCTNVGSNGRCTIWRMPCSL